MDILKERFVDGGIDTPYFLLAFRKSGTLIMFAILVVIPLLVVMTIAFKRVKVFKTTL